MGWIAVDLDGTLAVYDGWKGVENIGEPIPAMVQRVERWLSNGEEVRIFTARVTEQPGRDSAVARHYVETWCMRTFGRVLPVTNVKDFGMDELWDDRCVQVERNTGRPVGLSSRGLG